ncbi:type 1 glutamine amidotransferase [Glaciihabitans sp. dw_435]|uniref:type 1 glutamine amidotransferase n=1 Tax=Glaciihabitans sp. dw_435 TaxID=2720081 RepID=UPI001BD35E2B|nr:hypothetical protein [Glaciihabitans sp. dw_435]
MSSALTVLTVFPSAFNVNGDSENAAVLAQRARWSGHSVDVVRWQPGEPVPAAAPGIVVIGSTTDAALPSAIAELRPHRELLAGWIASGVPVLAIGTGWEILGASIELGGAAGTIAALGLVDGRAVAASARVSNDLVVSSAFGRLIGFENHARNWELASGSTPLGTVVYGRGNGATGTSEGLIQGSVIGTHLHGPVLAKNPSLADHLLGQVIEEYDARTVMSGRVDDIARAARNVIATRLELESE